LDDEKLAALKEELAVGAPPPCVGGSGGESDEEARTDGSTKDEGSNAAGGWRERRRLGERLWRRRVERRRASALSGALGEFERGMLIRSAPKVEASAEAARFLHSEAARKHGNVTRAAAARSLAQEASYRSCSSGNNNGEEGGGTGGDRGL